MRNSVKQILACETFDESDDGTIGETLDKVDSGVGSTTPDADLEGVENTASDIETAQDYVDVLDQSPAEGASPETLEIARIGLESIFNKYGVKKRIPACESVAGNTKQDTYAVLEVANEGIVDMAKRFGETCTGTLERLTTCSVFATRSKSSWKNEAKTLSSLLADASGTPNDAKYENRNRIAHITKGDKTVVTTGAELLQIFKAVDNGLYGLEDLLQKIGTLYTRFNSQKGKVDFDRTAGMFESSKFNPGMLSVSGVAGLSGKETVATPFGGKTTDATAMMKLAGEIRFKREEIWKISDLNITGLAPLSIAEMQHGISDFIKTGEIICDAIIRSTSTVGEIIKTVLSAIYLVWREVLHLVTSPIRYVRFNLSYYRLMYSIRASIGQSFETNFEAATCLLDYWKWSIKNNQPT